MKTSMRFVAVLLIGIGLYFIVHAQKPVPVRFIVGFDSTPQFADALAKTGAMVLPGLKKSSGDQYELYAVDGSTALISSTLPADSNEALTVLRSIVTINQTRLADFFDKLVPIVKASKQPVIVIVFTDGLSDEDVHYAEARIRLAAQQLRLCSNFQSLILCGLTRETRSLASGQIRAGLPELLGGIKDKLVVLPRSTLNPSPVLSAVKSARQSLIKGEKTDAN